MNYNHTFIIAEAGVNHNGSLDMAIEMVGVAAAAGADAVKFQTFKAEKVIAVNAPKAGYQMETTGSDESQLELVKKLELDEPAHRSLLNLCQENFSLTTTFKNDTHKGGFYVRQSAYRGCQQVQTTG